MDRVRATAEALGGNGRTTPHVTPKQATSLAAYAAQMRRVFDATDAAT